MVVTTKLYWMWVVSKLFIGWLAVCLRDLVVAVDYTPKQASVSRASLVISLASSRLFSCCFSTMFLLSVSQPSSILPSRQPVLLSTMRKIKDEVEDEDKKVKR